MEVREKITEHTKEVEDIITKFLPAEEGYQKTVMEAMNYSFLAGGKRLRPMLMLETYRLFGGSSKAIEPFMAAIEIHIHWCMMIFRQWIMMIIAVEEKRHMSYMERQWESLQVMHC